MELKLVVLVSVLSLMICSGSELRLFPSEGLRSAELDGRWEMYTAQFNKTYESSTVTKYRRLVWEESVREIEKHNAEADLGLHTWWMGLNEFSDMRPKEFAKLMLNGVRLDDKGGNATGSSYLSLDYLPSEVDWRKKNVVTPVKNQKKCGSCWAFSAVGALESAHAIKTGKLVSLSEQELVDCSGKYGNKGCDGGYPYRAIQYVIDNKGIDTESSYPYTAKQGPCQKRASSVGATARKVVRVAAGEINMQRVVAEIGPTGVSICVPESFFRYRTGIYKGDCIKTSGHHALVAVGYGTGYWLIKNSWGPTWGEQGYIRMARNAGDVCGIASNAVYAVV